MKQIRTCSALILCLLATSLLARSAAADVPQASSGTVQMQTNSWDPSNPNDPVATQTQTYDGIVRLALDGAWTTASSTICSQIVQYITTPDKVWKGQDLYDPVCSMGAASGDLKISQSGNAFTLQYRIPGNYLEFTSTQPFVGKWGDPRVSVAYDLLLTMVLPIPSATQALHVEQATVQLQNAKFDSHNAVADVLTAVNSIESFFGGPDFIAMAQQGIDGQQIDFTGKINEKLAALNGDLQNFAQQGFSQLHAMPIPGGGAPMLLSVSKPYAVPTSGDGTISGVIKWNSTYGKPPAYAGDCPFSVSGQVQTGPPQDGSPMASVGAFTIEAHAEQSAGEYQCRYSLSNLPTGIPVQIAAVIHSAWSAGYTVLNVAQIPAPSAIVVGAAPAPAPRFRNRMATSRVDPAIAQTRRPAPAPATVATHSTILRTAVPGLFVEPGQGADFEVHLRAKTMPATHAGGK